MTSDRVCKNCDYGLYASTGCGFYPPDREKGCEHFKPKCDDNPRSGMYDIDVWYKEMINMPIEVPQTYIDGWNAGRKQEPYDDTKPITWKCGYEDGRYNLPSSLL